jgi:hypothetical protein
MNEMASARAAGKSLFSPYACVAKAAKINIFCQVWVNISPLFSDFTTLWAALGEHLVAFIDKHLSAGKDLRI